MTGQKARQRQDIEHLVTWALRDQGLGWVGKERQQLDFSDYGTIIDDASSHPTIGLLCDDDATLIKAAIDDLDIEARALIIRYGRAGLRPDWIEEGYGSYQQLRDGRGRLRWEWADQVNRTGEKTPLKGFVGEQRETVDFHRGEYGVWWRALADIVVPLNAVMATHEATGPALSATPWTDSVSTVFGPDGAAMPSTIVPAKVTDKSLETRRAEASNMVRARAGDWGVPDIPMRREQTR